LDLDKETYIQQTHESLKNENATKSTIKDTPSHLDGGCLAWTIVAASFMVSFLQDGFRDSFGLLMPTISDHFKVGRAEATLTNSIMTFLTLGSGPLAAFMVKKLGHRIVTHIGVALSTAGLFIAAYYIGTSEAPNILVLYLSVGVMTGLGFGFMYLPAMDIVEVYFNRNLGLATGIAAAGSGFGQFIMAPLIHVAEESLRLEGTFYILAGVVSSAVIFGFIYRMPKEKKIGLGQGVENRTFQFDEDQVQDKWMNNNEKKISTSENEDKTKSETNSNILVSIKQSYQRVFQSRAMIILLASHFLMHLGIFAAFSFSTDRAVQFGISKHQTSILLSIMGVSNCLGRIIFGKILDRFRSKAIHLTTIVLIINALSITISDFVPSFIGQSVFSAIFGATFGAYISSVVVILKIIMDDITISLGVSLFTFAVASLIGPTSVGYLYDLTGSYTPGFLTVGVLSILGALLLPLVACSLPRSRLYTVNREEGL